MTDVHIGAIRERLNEAEHEGAQEGMALEYMTEAAIDLIGETLARQFTPEEVHELRATLEEYRDKKEPVIVGELDEEGIREIDQHVRYASNRMTVQASRAELLFDSGGPCAVVKLHPATTVLS